MGGVQSGPFTKYPSRQENRLLPVLQTYAFAGSSQGKRESMEDRDVIAVLDEQYFPYIQFFAIFDGHGGTTVSQFASKQLAKHISAQMLISCRQMESIFGHNDLSYQQTIRDMHIRSKAKQPGVFSCGKNVDYIEDDPDIDPRNYDGLYHSPSEISQLQKMDMVSPHGKIHRRQTVVDPLPQHQQHNTTSPHQSPEAISEDPMPHRNGDDEHKQHDDHDNHHNNRNTNAVTTDECYNNEPTPDPSPEHHFELFPKRQVKLPTLALQRVEDATKLPQPNSTIYATKQTTMPHHHLQRSAGVLSNRGIPPYLHKCLYWHTRYDILRSQLIHNAVAEAFISFDLELMNKFPTNSVSTGSTAVVVLVDTLHGTVFSANVGDSRAILSRNGTAVPLSQIHAPVAPAERDRIREQGLDVISNRVNGSLAISRALGDGHLKSNSVAAASHAHTILLEHDTNAPKPMVLTKSGTPAPPNGNARNGKGKSSERSEQEKMTNLLGLRRPFHNCKPWKNACSPVPFTLSTSVSSLAKDQFIVLGCDGLFDCLSEQTVVDWIVSRFRQVAVRALCNAHVYSYTPSTARFLDAMVKGRIQNFADHADKISSSSSTYPHIDQQFQLESRYEWALTQPTTQDKLLSMFEKLLVDRSNAILSQNAILDTTITSTTTTTTTTNLITTSHTSPNTTPNTTPNGSSHVSPLTPFGLSLHEFTQQLNHVYRANPDPSHQQIRDHITNYVAASSQSTTYSKPIDIPWHLLGLYSPLESRDINRERSILSLNMKQHAQLHLDAQQEQYGVRIWGQTGSGQSPPQQRQSKPKRIPDASDNKDDKLPKDPSKPYQRGAKASVQQQTKEANYGISSVDYAEQASANVLNAAKGCIFCGSDLLRPNRCASLVERQRGLRRLKDEHQSTQIHLLYSTAQSIFNKIRKPHHHHHGSAALSSHSGTTGFGRQGSFQQHGGEFKPGLLLRENSNLTHFTHRSSIDDDSYCDGPVDPGAILGVKLVQLYEQRPLFEMYGESDFQAQNYYNVSGAASNSNNAIAEYFDKLTAQKIRSDPGFVCPHCDYVNGFQLLPAVTPLDHFSAYVLPQHDLDINSNEDLLKAQQDILLEDGRYLAILPKHRLEKEREDKEKAEKAAFQQHQMLLAQQQLQQQREAQYQQELIERRERERERELLENNATLTTSVLLSIDPEIETPRSHHHHPISPLNNHTGAGRASVSSIPQLQHHNSNSNSNSQQLPIFNSDYAQTLSGPRGSVMSKKHGVNGRVSIDENATNPTPYQLSSFPYVPPANLFKQLVDLDLGSQAKIQIRRYLPNLSTVNNNCNYRVLNENGKRIVKIPYPIHNSNLRTRSFEYPLRHLPQRHLYTNDPMSTSLKIQEQIHQRYIRLIKHATAVKPPSKQQQQQQQQLQAQLFHQSNQSSSKNNTLPRNPRLTKIGNSPLVSPQNAPMSSVDPFSLSNPSMPTAAAGTGSSTAISLVVPPPASGSHQPFSLGQPANTVSISHRSSHNHHGISSTGQHQLCNIGIYHLGVEAITDVVSNLTPSCTTAPLVPPQPQSASPISPSDMDYLHTSILFDPKDQLKNSRSNSHYGHSGLPTDLTFNNKVLDKISSTSSSAFASPLILLKMIKCPVSNDTVFPAAFRRDYVGIVNTESNHNPSDSDPSTTSPTPSSTPRQTNNTFPSPHSINVFILPNPTIDITNTGRVVLARLIDDGWESLSAYEGQSAQLSPTVSTSDTPLSLDSVPSSEVTPGSILSNFNFASTAGPPTIPNLIDLFIANGLYSYGVKYRKINPEVAYIVTSSSPPTSTPTSANISTADHPSDNRMSSLLAPLPRPYIGKPLLQLQPSAYTHIITQSSSVLQSFLIVKVQLALFAHDYVVSMRNKHIVPILIAMEQQQRAKSLTWEQQPPTLTTSQSNTVTKSDIQSFQSFLQSRETSVDLSATTIKFTLDESKHHDALQTVGTFHNTPCNYTISARQFPLLHYSNDASAPYACAGKQPKSTTNEKSLNPRTQGGRVFSFDQPALSTAALTSSRLGDLEGEGLDRGSEGSKGLLNDTNTESVFTPAFLTTKHLKHSKSGQHVPLQQHNGALDKPLPTNDTDFEDDNVIFDPTYTSPVGSHSAHFAPLPNPSLPQNLAPFGSSTVSMKPAAVPAQSSNPPVTTLIPTSSFSLDNAQGDVPTPLEPQQRGSPRPNGQGVSTHDFGVLSGQIKQTFYADLSMVDGSANDHSGASGISTYYGPNSTANSSGLTKTKKTNTTRIYSIVAFYPNKVSAGRFGGVYSPAVSEGRNLTRSPSTKQPTLNNLPRSAAPTPSPNRHYHFKNAIEIIAPEHNVNLVLSADVLQKESQTAHYDQIFIFSNVPDLIQSRTHPHIFLVPYQTAPLFTHIPPHEHKAAIDLFSQNPVFFEVGLSPSNSLSSPLLAKPSAALQQSLYQSSFPITYDSIEATKTTFQALEAVPPASSPAVSPSTGPYNKPPYNPEALLIPVLQTHASALTTYSQSSGNGVSGGLHPRHDKFIDRFRSYQHIWLSMYISHLFYQQSQYQHASCHQNLITTATPLDICQKPTPRPLPDVVDTIGYTTELDLASYCLFPQSFHPHHPTNQLEESRKTTKPRIITNEMCSLEDSEGVSKDSNSNEVSDAKKPTHSHHAVQIVDDGSDDKISPALPRDHSAKATSSTEPIRSAMKPTQAGDSIHRLPDGVGSGAQILTHHQKQVLERERYHSQQERYLNKRDPKAFNNLFGSSLHNISFELIERALAAGSKDNISTIVLFFRFPLVENVIYSLENDNGQIDEIWDTSRKYLQYDESERDDDGGENGHHHPRQHDEEDVPVQIH